MKKQFLRPVYFIGKSLLWSLLLYMACMFIFNWDEMSAGFKKYRHGSPITQTQQTVPPPSAQVSSDKRSVLYAATRIALEELVKVITAFQK